MTIRYNKKDKAAFGQTLIAWHKVLAESRVQERLISSSLFGRFTAHYQRMTILPRKRRRALQRQWKYTLAGIAVLMALGQTPVMAGSVVGAQAQPKLILQITVDSFRGDYLHRFEHMLGDGGFRLLIEDGLWYVNAHHRHANTETIVGHTTLATGTDPSVHGMVANVWFDRTTKAEVYNVQDANYPLIGAAGVDAEMEIDPTQRAATTQGRSPKAILVTTISDEISMHFGQDAKIFGISVKDRGAISFAGHSGTAYWFSKADGRMVTSTYYAKAYPAWIKEWHDSEVIEAFSGKSWELSRARSNYMFAQSDDQPWETELGDFDRVFPHNYGTSESKLYNTLLTLSPAGDEIIADFAMTMIEKESLGQDTIPDYLSISFSSTDYVGHLFGPSSLEAEDNFGRLDRTLASLFNFVDERIGLENVLIVLSADHGSADAPGYVKQFGVDGGIVDLNALDVQPAIAALKSLFGVGGKLISKFSAPYLYLNQDIISKNRLDQGEVERAIAAELIKLPGIYDAVSSTALREEPLATSTARDSVLANFSPTRSGDIYVVFKPNWFIADFDGLTVAVTHGSPWAYDTHVPILIRGLGISSGRISRRVDTVDLAPTIAAYLGTKYPSGMRGNPLVEVLDKAD